MLLIFDANALLHRLFHALPELKDSQGRTTNALYGLTNILWRVINEFKPQYGVACYDRPEPTFRHQILPSYKSQRPKVPSELVFQLVQSKNFFEAFGFKTIEKSGYEADDLIGTLVEKFKNKVEKIIIVTGDLDTLQLVEDEKVVVWTMKKGISEVIIYDEKKVKEKYNLLPSQIPDYKALVGDQSDNIEGIKGIGPKSGQNLIKLYGSIEKIIDLAKKGLIEKKLSQKIIENEEKLFLFKELVTIKRRLELEVNLEDLKVLPINTERLISLLKEFEFRSILKRLESINLPPNQKLNQIDFKPINNLPEEEKNYLLIKEDKIYYYLNNQTIGVLNLNNIPLLSFFKKEMIAFETKQIFKTNLKNHLKDYFDLKIVYWLTNPDIKKITPTKLTQFILNTSFAEEEKNVIYFPEIEKAINQKFKELELEKLWEVIEKPLVPILAKIEDWGLKINQSKLKNNLIYFRTQKDILEKKIFSLTGQKINLNSWQQINWLLFEKLKIKPQTKIKTKSGLLSTQKTILEKLKDQHPVIELILKYRQYQKILTGYLENFLDSPRIKTTFDQTLSATGRIISINPNFLNLPKKDESKKILEIFEPEENFIFVSFDYAQMEIFLAGYLAKEEKIVQSIQAGLDFHALVAKEVFGNENFRDLAKTLNFGILYGMGPKSIAELTGFEIDQAKEYLENYFLRFPKLAKYLNELKEKAKIYGYAENIFGRKRFLPDIISENVKERQAAERAAINSPIQSLAADILKLALIKLNNIINDEVRLVIPWYDEIIFEIKKDKKTPELINQIIFILENINEQKLNFELKLKVKIKEGNNLAELR